MSSMQRRIDPTTGEEEWYDADPNYAYGDPRAGANPTQPSEFRDMSVLVDPREPTQDLKLPPTPTAPTLEQTNIFGQTADEAAETGPLGMRPRFYGSPGKGIRSQPQYGGGFGGYQPPMYGGGGYPAGPGKGRAPSRIPSQNAYYDENHIGKLTKEDPYGLIPYEEPVQTPPPPSSITEDAGGNSAVVRSGDEMLTSKPQRPRFYGSPGKGMRPQPYGGGFGGYQQPFYGGGFGGGFGGYQQPFYGGGFGGYPRSPYGGGFGGGVFSQGYGVPRGIASLLSNYPSYMPPRMPFNPYAR